MTTHVRKLTTLNILIAELCNIREYLCLKLGFEFFYRPWHTGICLVKKKEVFLEGVSNLFGMSSEEDGHVGYLTFETPDGKVDILVPKVLFNCIGLGSNMRIAWRISRINSANLDGKLAPHWE